MITTGSSKGGDRELAAWDLRNTGSPLKKLSLDKGSGVLYPFYDPDTTVLFVSGKGDGNVRYFEVVGDSNYLYYLESFKSNNICRGFSFTPKYTVDTSVCEIMKGVKLTNNNSIDLISFRVPRRSEAFQEDIYPDCISNIPALSGDGWLSGASKGPNRIPIREASGTSIQVDIKAAKTSQDYERELHEAHQEIEALRKRVSQLETELRAVKG